LDLKTGQKRSVLETKLVSIVIKGLWTDVLLYDYRLIFKKAVRDRRHEQPLFLGNLMAFDCPSSSYNS